MVAVFSVIGGIAAVIGLIGTYVAWQDRHREPTLADWTREATTVCERRSHDIRTPLRGSLDEFSGLLGQMQVSVATGTPPDLTRLRDSAARLEDTADAIRAMMGDFRVIARPPASQADIERLLANGATVSQRFTDIASGIRELDGNLRRIDWSAPATSGSAVAQAVQSVQTLLPAVQRMNDDVMPAWNESLAALNLGTCLPSTGGYTVPSTADTAGALGPPPSGPGTPSGPGAPSGPGPPASTTIPDEGPRYTGAEAELLAAINHDEFRECAPKAADENAATVAALNCAPVRPGPTRKPLVARAADSAALTRLADNEGRGVRSPSQCSQGGDFRGTWSDSTGTRRGTLICKTNGRYFRMWWADSRTNIYMIAEGENATDLYRWWAHGAF